MVWCGTCTVASCSLRWEGCSGSTHLILCNRKEGHTNIITLWAYYRCFFTANLTNMRCVFNNIFCFAVLLLPTPLPPTHCHHRQKLPGGSKRES